MVQTELNQREILEKDFGSKLRGYDPQEVDEFLDAVIRDYKVYDNYIEDLKKENDRLSKGVNNMYKRLEAAMKKNEALTKKLDSLEQGDTVQTDENDTSDKNVETNNKEEQLADQQKQLTEKSAAEDQSSELTDKTRVMKGPALIKNPVKGPSRPKVETDTKNEAVQETSSQSSQLNSSTQSQPSNRPSATILDLLKRVSNLERAVFGEDADEPKQ